MFLFYCKIMSDADKCYINISKICSEPSTLALKLESMHKKLWEIENKLYILKFSAVKMKKRDSKRRTFQLYFNYCTYEIRNFKKQPPWPQKCALLACIRGKS